MNEFKRIITQNPIGMESFPQNRVGNHSAYPDLSPKTCARIRGFCIIRERIERNGNQ